MRKKFSGKRFIAYAMTAAMALSVINVPAVSNWMVPMANVQAEEATASGTPLWSSDEETSLTIDTVKDTAWDENEFVNNAGVDVGTKVKVTAKVSVGDISELSKEDTLFQLQGYIKTGSKWAWLDSTAVLDLKPADFTDGVADVTFEYNVLEENVGALATIGFKYGAGTYKGNIIISDVAVYDAVEVAETQVWSSDEETSLTIDTVSDTAWGENEFVNNAGVDVGTKVKVTAKVSVGDISELSKEDTLFQLQGYIKTGSKWAWLDSTAVLDLKPADFTDGVADVTFEYNVLEENVGALATIGFKYGAGTYKGKVTISDVVVYDVLEPETEVETEEKVVYENSKKVSLDFDFSKLTEEDWGETTMPTMTYDSEVEDVTLTDEFIVSGTLSLDAAAYESMGENALKLQAVVKMPSWKDALVTFEQSDFTKSGDVYSVEFSKKIAGTGGGDLADVIFRLAGLGTKGTFTISDVKITNIVATSGEIELEEADPYVISSFDDGLGDWIGEGGYQYYHGGAANAAPEVSYDEEKGAMKVTLDYSANSEKNWSEAKISMSSETGYDISNYNLLTFKLTYPEAFNSFKVKTFGKTADDSTFVSLDDSSIKDVVDNGNGTKTATVSAKFSPSKSAATYFMFGLVGVNTDFQGDVWIDDVTLDQYNALADYVQITETVTTTPASADLSEMATKVDLVDKEATSQTRALAAYLLGLQGRDQVLFGHQNSTFKSVNSNGEVSDIKDITGSESGLFGIDSLSLTGVEIGATSAADAIEKSVAASKKAWEGGSIISLSCHMPNFGSETTITYDEETGKYDFTACDFDQSKELTPKDCAGEVLDGGKYNEAFNQYLDIIAEYALELQAANIPVLFRPFHENTGGWFWWGTATTTVDEYQAMWRYMVNYLDDKGVDNFLYVYSPNGPLTSEADYLKRYPGDDYVDVLAFDYYDDYADKSKYTGDSFFNVLATSCKVVSGLAEKKGKIPAIAETGIRITGAGADSLIVSGNPTTGHDWYNKLIDVAVDNDIPYFLIWANFSTTNFFIPYKYNDEYGHEMINEFISAYNNENSIFGSGTNFYTEAVKKTVEEKETTPNPTGYMIAPKNYDVIDSPGYILKAYVKDADSVKFEVAANASAEVISIPASAQEDSNVYTAILDEEDLETLGETSTGIVKVIATVGDSTVEVGVVRYINFNKDVDVLEKPIFDQFEYYYGDDDLLQSKYGSASSAANCSSDVTLDATNKAEGEYSMAFNYTLTYSGAEGYTGGYGRAFDDTDFSEYNALSMWVKPDGNGQKVVVQLIGTDGGEYEAYLTDLAKRTEAQYITIPFSNFIDKNSEKPLDITKVGISAYKFWCNTIPANYPGEKDENGYYTVNGTICYDDIKAVNVSDEDLAAADAVVEKMEAIGEVTVDSKDKITAARKAYDALTATQKALIPAKALNALTDAEKEYAKLEKADADAKAVAKVQEAIEAIGKVDTTDACKAKIDAARKAYDTLTDEQKKLVATEVLKALTDAEKSYTDLKKAEYDKMTEEQKQAENKKQADAVKALITAIGTVDDSAESKAKVEAARKAYDALTDEQKKLISTDELKVLTEAETKYAELSGLAALVGKTAKAKDGSASYKVTAVTNGVVEVSYTKPAKKKSKVTIPATVTLADGTVANVTSIAAQAFKKNTKLTEITIGSNVKSIGKEAFSGCSKLKKVKSAKNVETIGASAFANCKKLSSITLGSKVTTIGDKAFYKCTSLKKITIPAKVNKIGKEAFSGCKNLKSITIKTTKLTKKNVGSKAFKGISSKATIKVPKKKLSAYKKVLKAKGVSSKVKIKK